ncbi:hypothetical protein HUO09_17275 [Vibrio sp. Y2-5]|uniref:hypothetical protein n=1 Tax=Vibrio sp. Y2-5 TaxID=2743977 RepID=UPI0016615BC1|nr:hypothetical protein [Vibrio sp. Y2-5]MBD0788108.1 hypothetical protein [Vibrio sp. Y2-5]
MDFSNQDKQKEYIDFRFKQGVDVMPTCVMTTKSGEVRAFTVPFSNDDEKRNCILALRRLVQKLEVVTYTFIATVKMGASNGIRPSEQLDNREGVMFSVRTRNSVDLTVWMVEKSEDGSKRPVNPAKTGDAGGELSDLFDSAPYNRLTYTQKRKIDKVVKTLLKPQTVH